MRRRFRLLLPLVTIALSLLPGTANAYVPRIDMTWVPGTGAELLEAVDEINALTPTADSETARIELSGYLIVDRPIRLLGNYPVEIAGTASGATIFNAYGAPGTLLESVDRDGEWPAVIHDVNFEIQGASSSPFAAVDVGARVTLRDVQVYLPGDSPSATGVRMRTESAADGLTITSLAPAAPALRAEPGAEVSRVELSGGEPTLEVANGPGTRRSVRVQGGHVRGGPYTQRVVATAGSDAHLDATLSNLEVLAGDVSTTLVEASGATGIAPPGGGTELSLRGLTLVAGFSTTAGLRVASGVTGSATSVEIEGLLSLGTTPAVACTPDGAATLAVRIRGIYREGRLVPAAGCTISETGRRTGALNVADRNNFDFAPRWGSPLIDGAPQRPGPDALGLPRPSDKGDGSVDAWTGDIGALEYQYTPPVVDEISSKALGNRGVVRLDATAYDPDLAEDALYGLTYTWRFSDGAVLEGQTVVHRFATPADVFDLADWQAGVELTITDVSGARTSASRPLRPWIAECEAATDSDAYERGEYCPIVVSPSTPTPTPSPAVAATPPTQVVTPAPTAVPPTPTLFTSLETIRGRASLRSRRGTGFASARSSEAALRLDLRDAAKVTVRADRVKGRVAKPVKGGSITVDAAAGRRLLRITPRIGKARLGRGLYVITIEARPRSGGSAVVRRVNVRVVA